MKKSLYILVIILIANVSYSQEFWCWNTFDHSKFSKEIHSVEIYKNQVIIGGKFDKIVGGPQIRGIARWNGNQWVSMGGESGTEIYSMTVWNGYLIAAGKFNGIDGISANNIARWNGTTWQPLGNGLNKEIYCVTIDSSGNLIAGGKFDKSGSTDVKAVGKWTGTSWVQLGGGLDNDVYYLTTYAGDIVACGKFTGKIQRFQNNNWTVLGTGLNDEAYTLVEYNGSLIAGGKFTGHIAKLNGNSWQTFGNGVSNHVLTLSTLNDKLIAGGEFMYAGNQQDSMYVNRIALWDNNWNYFSTGMNGEVYFIKNFDSVIVAVGDFTSAGGDTAYNIAKWNIIPIRTIEGTVRYGDNNQPVEGGKVYAAKIDVYTKELMYLDTAVIESIGENTGKYKLSKVPKGMCDLLIAFPSDEDDNPIIFPHYIPTYYPGEILWKNASRIPLYQNLTNMDIFVERTAIFQQGSNSIWGKARLKFTPEGYPPTGGFSFKAGTHVIAKKNNNYYSFDVSDKYENFLIDSLPDGNYTLIADRLGYGEVYLQIDLITAGGGENLYIELDTISIITGIVNGNGNVIPDKFTLYQNYPNPFNPSSTIKFDLPTGSHIKLKVYDIAGREVVTLFDNELSAGSYEAVWNASKYSSGVYFYSLEADGFKETRKMILIK